MRKDPRPFTLAFVLVQKMKRLNLFSLKYKIILKEC